MIDGLPEWMSVVAAIALGFLSVILGSRIQKGTKFVYPKDIFTICLMTFLFVDMILCIFGYFVDVPHTPFLFYAFHIPIILGFIVGYWINGNQKTKQLIWTDENGNDCSAYYVFYENKMGQLCIADQTNKEMIKRVFFGIHHEVYIPGGVSFYQKETKKVLKRPWWPTFYYEEIEILDIRPMPTKSIKKGKRTYLQYITRIILADKYNVNLAQFRKNMSITRDMNMTITFLSTEINNLNNQMETKVYEKSTQLNSDIRGYRPIQFYFDEKERKKLEKEEEENAIQSKSEEK